MSGASPCRGGGRVGQSKRLAGNLGAGGGEGDLSGAGVCNSVTTLFFFETREAPQTPEGLPVAALMHPQRGFRKVAGPVWRGRGGPGQGRAGEGAGTHRALWRFWVAEPQHIGYAILSEDALAVLRVVLPFV